MANIRNRIEKWFEGFASFIYHNRIKTLVAMLCLVALFVSRIPDITFDLSTEGMLHADDPAFLNYREFRDQFGRDELLIIAISPPDVFNQKFLKKIKQLHEELKETVPYLEDITSIVNARNTRGEAKELIVEDLLENWPDTQDKMNALKNRILSNEMYKNMLISEDGKFTTIIIKTQNYSLKGKNQDVLDGFDDDDLDFSETPESSDEKEELLSEKENGEVVTAIQKILSKYKTSDFNIYVAGSPTFIHFLKQSMMTDVRKFMALAVITIAIFLFIMFKRISGVLLPLFIVILSLVSTAGLLAATGTPIKVPTQVIPSFLLAVGIGASVHILAIFYQRLQYTNDKEDAICFALGHSGLAVAMTHVTTACGLLSFSTAKIAPIADLGIFASAGVLLALVYTLVLLPAVLALIPIKAKQTSKDSGQSTFMDNVLKRIGNFSTTYPVYILIVTAIIIVLSLIFASRIRFSHNPLEWFKKNNPIRIATEKIDHELRGSVSLEILIDTGRENGLYDPDILESLEKAAVYVESLEYGEVFVGKAWSLTTILKEINQALNENKPEAYIIPKDKDLVAQEFLLFENSGSDDLEDIVDSQFSKARFMVKVPFTDAMKYREFFNQIDTYFSENFKDMKITVTGMIALLLKTVSGAIISMAQSYIIALFVITILMIFLIGKVRIGLLSMIPNLTPIIVMLGIMGAFSIPMDLFTMMVGSIAIGLAVDDTIHFMHNFRRYFEEKQDPVTAVHDTLQTAGRAMLVTTIVLSLGFFIYIFSSMNNLLYFGFLTGITIIMALLADYFIAPALMVIVNKKDPH